MLHGTPRTRLLAVLAPVMCLCGHQALAADDHFDMLTFEQFAGRQLSASPINGSADADNAPLSGRGLAYQTSEGRFGKLQITSCARDSTVQWVTFRADGSVHSQGTGLTVRGTCVCDLDAGREARASAEFFWGQA